MVIGFHLPASFVVIDLALTLIGPDIVIAATTPRPETFHIDVSNQESMHYLSRIVESLENLGVLESSHTKCYALDKILKVEQNVNQGNWKINIELHIDEFGVVRSDGRTMDGAITKPRGESGECVGTATPVTRRERPRSTAKPGRSYEAGPAADRVSPDGSESGTAAPVTGASESALSLAQIMVISSCSIVIGLFFLVALTMRIRNFIKRRSELQEARRTTYRSSDVKVGSKHPRVVTVPNTVVPKNNQQNSATVSQTQGAALVEAKPFPVDRLQWYEREYLLSM